MGCAKCFELRKRLKWTSRQDESVCVHCQRAIVHGDAQRNTILFAVHMKLFCTGPDLRIRCEALPQLEALEFPVRSSTLAQLGFHDVLCGLGYHMDLHL